MPIGGPTGISATIRGSGGERIRSEIRAEIADIVTAYTKFNARRKPELLEPTTYSLVNYQEADKVVMDFRAIEAKAEELFARIPQGAKDAFYDLVFFPR